MMAEGGWNELLEREQLERARKLALYTPEVQAGVDRAKLAAAAHSTGAAERKVPRWDALKDEHRYEDDPRVEEEILEEWMPVIAPVIRPDVIDRAVHNSPPPLDDVGGVDPNDFDPKDPNRPQGLKYDDDKIDLTYLADDFPDALAAVCRVAEFGAKKYARGNWKLVEDGQHRYLKALFRHLFTQETFDLETGLPHLAHAAWNALAALQFLLDGKEMRYGPSS